MLSKWQVRCYWPQFGTCEPVEQQWSGSYCPRRGAAGCQSRSQPWYGSMPNWTNTPHNQYNQWLLIFYGCVMCNINASEGVMERCYFLGIYIQEIFDRFSSHWGQLIEVPYAKHGKQNISYHIPCKCNIGSNINICYHIYLMSYCHIKSIYTSCPNKTSNIFVDLRLCD